MRVSSVILVACSFLNAGSLLSQTPSQLPNKIDKAGKRDGKWTIWLDKQSKATQNKDSVVFFREITYLEGKPIGLVKDFYLTGKTRWEGYLVSDQPEDIFNGKAIWYDEAGNKTEEAQYNRIGRKTSSTLFNKSGAMGDSLIRLNQQGMIYFQQGNFSKSLEYWEEGKTLAEKKFGTQNKNYAIFLNNLAMVYQTIGSFEKAEPLILKTLQIFKVESDPEYGGAINNLAVLYMEEGKYYKAEPLFLQTLQTFKTQHRTNHPAYLTCLGNLGILYFSMGRNDKAEPLLLEATQSIYGSILPNYTVSLNSLASLYLATGRKREAERLILKAVELDKNFHGENHLNYSYSLSNLGQFYRSAGKLAKAQLYFQQSNLIIKNQLGENHPDFANSLSSLADLDFRMGNYASAESGLLQALQIITTQFGDGSPPCAGYYQDLAKMYLGKGSYEKAEPYFLKANENLIKQIEQNFPFLSEKEKEEFYQTIKKGFANFHAYALLRYPVNPGITAEMFNVQLSTKALLLNSSAKWKQRIRNSGDKKLSALYYAWEDKQAFLARLYKETDSVKRKAIDTLQREANALEKELSKRSETFAQFADKKRYTWQDVQQKLIPGEAAIEMIRMRKYGVAEIVTDSSNASLPRYPKRGLTDTIYYAVLIVTPSSKQPALVVLKNGNELEKQKLNYYRNFIGSQKIDELSYDQFWKPISKILGKKIKKVYFSPDGVYNSINLNTLLNPETKKYLLEEIDIQLVTTSKDLLASRKEEDYNKLAYLIGYPNYQTSKEKRATLVEKERSAQPAYYALNIERGNNLKDLPGTKIEVENIASLLTEKGWQPELLMEDKALEETLKDAFKPRILHIATHGYFQPDSLLSAHTNPLIQSGLMLTGAGRTLGGDKDEKTEDGILTAYEAMNLNLDNTDLVVLSACETGLGEIRNGEGVYGLQRAFKVAGARSIIMSLWKVNDEATQELITNFYKFWLESGNKRDAFKKAQMSIQTKYPSPFYWGAFVMVGE